MKTLATGIICLLITAAASAGVVVVADDGAALRIDAAKLAGMTDAAIRHAAPRAAGFTVSIAIEAPRVWLGSHGINDRTPLPANAVPPSTRRTGGRGALQTSETLSVTYTITDPSGVVRESVPMVLAVAHGSTLESRLTAMRRTADAIAARVRAISGN
ncbi:MAG: hypothetical protein AABO58_23245 [Acidobacteriota bacterium]